MFVFQKSKLAPLGVVISLDEDDVLVTAIELIDVMRMMGVNKLIVHLSSPTKCGGGRREGLACGVNLLALGLMSGWLKDKLEIARSTEWVQDINNLKTQVSGGV